MDSQGVIPGRLSVTTTIVITTASTLAATAVIIATASATLTAATRIVIGVVIARADRAAMIVIGIGIIEIGVIGVIIATLWRRSNILRGGYLHAGHSERTVRVDNAFHFHLIPNIEW